MAATTLTIAAPVRVVAATETAERAYLKVAICSNSCSVGAAAAAATEELKRQEPADIALIFVGLPLTVARARRLALSAAFGTLCNELAKAASIAIDITSAAGTNK